MIDLTGQLAVVTGAGSGIGRAVALTLHEAGATVIAADQNVEGARETVASLDGQRAEARHVDVVEADSVLALRDNVVDEHGTPQVVVNAAGWDRVERFMDTDIELWRRVIDVNYLGPVQVCRAFLEPLIEADSGGRIVNIGSDAGRVGSSGESVYAGAKGGVIAFTKSLAREVARYRINVNCVCPGPTDTPLFQAQPERMREALVHAIPFRRLAQPQEVADAVLFFSSSRAAFVTGQVLSVSGGLTMAG